ncbi:MAG: hypothetical protein KME10_23650 [Plectolyngbya sp. WJT66-NPBG17]|jgi:hypothetical protein|nr:hypothetical protein [Plectolyngbya sp. WJT66-NPBG17]
MKLLLGITCILLTATPVFAQTALIDSATGNVLLKRRTWSDFLPTGINTALDEQDQIRVTNGSRVRVTCPNHRNPSWTSEQPTGVRRLCGGWGLVKSRGTQAAAVLGGADASIPYLLSPRHTLLLSNTPTFRWNAVPEAKQYTIQLKSPKGIIWETNTQATQISFAGTPTLQSGVAYSLIVKASNGKSSDQDGTANQRSTDLDFRILRPSEAETVKAEVAAIVQSSTTPEVIALRLANYYGNYVLPNSAIQAYGLSDPLFETYSLTTDGINILEAQLKQGKASSILHRALGNLYWQIGLVQPAISHYTQALSLIRSSQDLEEWTLAHYTLGQIYTATNSTTNALNAYQQARIGFLFLGDTQRAGALERRIDKLKKE